MPDEIQPELDPEQNAKTLGIEIKNLRLSAIQQTNGLATTVRFQIMNPFIKPGEVLLVLDGPDIHFHGFIRYIEDGWAIATDTNSLLPIPAIN